MKRKFTFHWMTASNKQRSAKLLLLLSVIWTTHYTLNGITSRLRKNVNSLVTQRSVRKLKSNALKAWPWLSYMRLLTVFVTRCLWLDEIVWIFQATFQLTTQQQQLHTFVVQINNSYYLHRSTFNLHSLALSQTVSILIFIHSHILHGIKWCRIFENIMK